MNLFRHIASRTTRMRTLHVALCCALFGLLAAEQPALAAEAESSTSRTQVRLDEDVITGSSELPKVLYILPWRAAEGTAGLNAAPVLKAKELFEPLDPDAHARLLQYRQRLLGDPVDGG